MKTLYKQFIVAILFILMSSVFIAFVLANFFYLNVTKKESDLQHVEIAQEVVHILENMHNDSNSFDGYLTSIAKLGYQIAVVPEDGEALYYGKAFDKTSLTDEALRVLTEQEIYHGMHNFSNQMFMMSHFANELQNTVGVPFTIEDKRYGLFLRSSTQLLSSDIHTVLIGFILTITIVSIVGVLWLARQLTRPIAQLTEATKQLAQENYSHTLNIQRNDEIGQLAESFNAMQLQMQHNDLARKAFISNVSHDFQSPLMNIQGYADLLKSTALTADEHSEYISIIDLEAKRLSSLTKQLLLLTSLDQASYPVKYTMYDLDRQLKDIVMKFHWRLEEASIDISYKLMPTSIMADEELLANVWENLLSNAIKYNRLNGNIEIALTTEGNLIVVSIKDTGIGIPKEAIPQLFDRFFRVDSARKRDGTGLGLSIVEQIISLHNGGIFIKSTVDEGTTFTIKIPKRKN